MSQPNPRRRLLVILSAVALALAVAAVLIARMLRELPEVRDFLQAYPGEVPPPPGTPVGFPWWLNWSHALNSFFLLFIVASGLRIRSKQRPPAFWTRDHTRFPRTAKPGTRLSIHTWWHLVVDTLFVLNGVVFVVLLITTGQWLRLVPLSWDVIPNAVSAGLQYASLDWPTHHGWINYNSLQQLSYFATVFLAGPLALVTGLRLSPTWPAGWRRASGLLGDRAARTAHTAVLWYFIAFTVVHVGLVFATGILRNLNTMYAGRDDESPIGLLVFLGSLAVAALLWVLFRPARLLRIAKRTGNVREMPAPRKP